MRTNIEIDDKLMKQAMKVSGATTKRAVVEEALQLMVKIRAQEGIHKLFGIGGWATDYDYKAMRLKDKWDGPSSAGAEDSFQVRPTLAATKRGIRKKAA